MIAGRTRSALAAAKAKGVKLRNPHIEAACGEAVAAIKSEADRAAGNVLPIIAEIQKSGATTLRAIAEALNARGVATPRSGRWHAMSVRNAIAPADSENALALIKRAAERLLRRQQAGPARVE